MQRSFPRPLRALVVVIVALAVVVGTIVLVDARAAHRADVDEARTSQPGGAAGPGQEAGTGKSGTGQSGSGQSGSGKSGAAHGTGPSGSLGKVAVPDDSDDFQRFRLGAIDGTRLTPNKTDFAARTSDQGPLLLFLPATRAKPADYQLFLSTATAAGYHVLGLDYWNLGTTLNGTCQADPHCYSQVQRNRFDGTDPSQFSKVGPAGSIASRLHDAISYLVTADPGGGWNRYLDSDGIRWSDVVVAGHSQGGGEAAFIAHVRHVRGALMFSSPVEADGPVHAAWMDHPGQTPISDMYSLDDVNDVFGPHILGSWRALGLDGASGPFRTRTAPPGSTDPHAILTRLDVGNPGQSHSLTIDDSTPLRADGTPEMLPLWEWMLHRFPLPATNASDTAADAATPAPATPALATPAPRTPAPTTPAPTTAATPTPSS